MIVGKVSSNSELLDFFKSKDLRLNEIAELLNLSEEVLAAVQEGRQTLSEAERTKLINFYHYLHLLNEETEQD